jgi:membrane protein required for colicin V production
LLEVRVNWLDVCLVLTVAVSIVSGLHTGFAKAGVGFVASVLGLVFGLHYYRVVGLCFRGYIAKSGVADALGFLIVFCSITIAGAVVSGLLRRFLRATDLSGVDRLLGGAFGAARGLLFDTVIILGLMAFAPVPPRQAISHSRFAPCVMDAAREVAEASPDEVKRTFRQSYRELNKVLPKNIREKLSTVPPGQI